MTLTVVGIVGGIGSGKSAVSEQFRLLGAEVLDGDRIGHEVLDHPEVVEQLRRRWGDRILASPAETEISGAGRPSDANQPETDQAETNPPTRSTRINRSAVAQIVFGQPPQAEKELQFLEAVTHPKIRARVRSHLEALAAAVCAAEAPAVVVIDAPLLLEAGWNEFCDHLLFVDAPREVRLERVGRRGWNAADLAAREARQLPVAEKRQRCDLVVDNSQGIAELAAQIREIWDRLTLPKSA